MWREQRCGEPRGCPGVHSEQPEAMVKWFRGTHTEGKVFYIVLNCDALLTGTASSTNKRSQRHCRPRGATHATLVNNPHWCAAIEHATTTT